jgi:hypothetical protein
MDVFLYDRLFKVEDQGQRTRRRQLPGQSQPGLPARRAGLWRTSPAEAQVEERFQFERKGSSAWTSPASPRPVFTAHHATGHLGKDGGEGRVRQR